ncbi:hypothetical protein ACFQ9X_21500 [Catenulispora yoronensis]
MIAPAAAAFLIAFVTFFLIMDTAAAMSGRLGILGTAMFAVIINMGAASNTLGSVDGVTLLDKLHLACLAYILSALMVTVRTWHIQHAEVGPAALVAFNRRWVLILSTGYLLLTAMLIGDAIVSG